MKDVRIDPGSSSPTRAAVQIGSGARQISIHDGPLSALQYKSLQGFIVLEPGDTVRLYSEGGTFDAWVSGAELDGLAP